MNLYIKNSQNKHESDIPRLDIDSTVETFCANRDVLLSKLKEIKQCDKQISVIPLDIKIKSLYEVILKKELARSEVEFVFTIEKRFILTGNIYLKKNQETTAKVTDSYVYLAAILLSFFTKNQDVNALNSAVRLNDKVSSLSDESLGLLDISNIIYVLNVEKKALMILSKML